MKQGEQYFFKESLISAETSANI